MIENSMRSTTSKIRLAGVTISCVGIAQVGLTFGSWAVFDYRSSVMPDLELHGTANSYGSSKSDEFGAYALNEAMQRPIFGATVIGLGILGILLGMALTFNIASRRGTVVVIVASCLVSILTVLLSAYVVTNPQFLFGEDPPVPQSTQFGGGSALFWTMGVAVFQFAVAAFAMFIATHRGNVDRVTLESMEPEQEVR